MPRLGSLIDPRPMKTDLALLILRVVFGLAMGIAHGWGKLPVDQSFIDVIDRLGIPAPVFFAWIAVLAEFIGGLLLVIGLLTRPAALAVLGTMLIAVFIRYSGRPFYERELATLYSAACLALFFTGPGRYSLDHMLSSNKA